MATAEGLGIAFENDTFDDDPTFVRVDNPESRNDVERIEITRGRNSILNRTEAGTMEFTLKNNDGAYDITNSGSPFYGSTLPLRQVQYAPRHPITGDFIPVFTGLIEDYSFSRRGRTISDADVSCADGFEPLSKAQVVPDSRRSAASAYYASQRVNDRIIALLADAGWPAAWAVPAPFGNDIYEGNVNVQETTYSPGATFLEALFDAADAEFPGVSNAYISRDGHFKFRGRYDRFNFEDYPRNYWLLGDSDAVESSPSLIPIYDMKWSYGKSSIINTALVTPHGVSDTDIPGQRVYDTASRNRYGERPLTIPGLIVLDQPADETTAVQECRRYAQYYVDNWKDPRILIDSLVVRGHQGELRADRESIWSFCLSVEIGDIIYATTTHPGGGGITGGYFVEGIHHLIEPMNRNFPKWETSVEISPIEAFASFPPPPS